MTNFFKHKLRRKSPGEIAGWVIFGGLGIIGLVILFGYVIMWLWNWLMPELFGLSTINYWQAIGLFILFKILIGGCGGGKSGKSSKKSNSSCGGKKEGDFSKWKHYAKFWEEEGDKAYKDYVDREIHNNKPETLEE